MRFRGAAFRPLLEPGGEGGESGGWGKGRNQCSSSCSGSVGVNPEN